MSLPNSAERLRARHHVRAQGARAPRAGGRPSPGAPRDRLDEADREFASVKPIGEQTSQTLEFTPARLVVIEHVRLEVPLVYADGQSTVRTAQAYPSPIPKSNAGPGAPCRCWSPSTATGCRLRAWSACSRATVRRSRARRCATRCCSRAELLGALHAPFRAHVLGAPVVFGDDTTLRLINDDRAVGGCITARLWGYVSAGSVRDDTGVWHAYPKAVFYEFTRNRRGEHPSRFLEHYSGYLQADDYAGYVAREDMWPSTLLTAHSYERVAR